MQVRDRLEGATELALTQAMRAAQGSRRIVGDQKSWMNTALATALGAAGGAGGLPGALAELPVTTTVLLRAIQDAAAGPLARDDGADLAFVSTRLALTGGAMKTLIARVAPRLSVVLGQKLAAQAVPVLGAVAGAATNYAYTSYYQEIAHVHFGLRRLAIDGDLDHDALVTRMKALMRGGKIS